MATPQRNVSISVNTIFFALYRDLVGTSTLEVELHQGAACARTRCFSPDSFCVVSRGSRSHPNRPGESGGDEPRGHRHVTTLNLNRYFAFLLRIAQLSPVGPTSSKSLHSFCSVPGAALSVLRTMTASSCG